MVPARTRSAIPMSRLAHAPYITPVRAGWSGNAGGMAENLEIAATRDPHQCYAARLRGTDCKGCGRRNRDHDARANGSCLLHHLDGYAAGQHDCSGAACDVPARQRAGELIKGVMPSGIFAHYHGLAAWYKKPGCVRSSRLMVEQLRRSERLDR